MSSHSDEVLLKFGELQVISVRRRHVWEDTVDFLSKPFIDWRCPLYIHFVGEPAQDEGGPKREFFRLSLQGALNDSNLFRGLSSGLCIPVSSTHSLLQKLYFKFGKLASIVHGGPGPLCFPTWLYDYMCGLESSCTSTDCICPATAQVLSKVHSFGNADMYLFIFASLLS